MKFNTLYEGMLERYQQGGFVIGDRVRYRKDCLKSEFFRHKPQNFIDLIKSCLDKNFDLNLRVSSIKSIYPTTSQNYSGGTEAPDGLYVDVIIEYAPGLYRTPMTVPIDVLEIFDDGANRGPVPDSLYRKSNINIKPEEIKTKSDKNFEINLQNINIKLPNSGAKHDFSKPHTGWEPLPTK